MIFKPRTSSIESTLHRRHGEMASVIDKMTRDQPNLRLSFKPATRLLRQCGCAITVSSTAAMESMAMGISTRIVGDLGVTETLGNHFFASSGAIATFAAIKANPFDVIHDAQWLEQQGLQRDGENRFITALVDRLNSPATPLGASSHGPHQLGQQCLAEGRPAQRRPADAEQRWGPLQPAQTSPHPPHAAQHARRRGGIRLALQTAAGTMTLLLVSDGGLERSACLLMAEALEQHGEQCITAGPTLQGHEPLPTAAPQLNIEVQQLAAHPLLDQVSAIGMFLQDPKQVQRFIQTYQGVCSSRNRPAATVFSGPLVPLVGDALIRDLSLRMGCDLLLVSGEHQRRQLQSSPSTGPPACGSRP